ncbi:formate dehydrogenase accessory protein FdhE [Bacillus canaveralius]|uniref:formate dehydrogenase accessory protein FdhE n=1 Tax=Bacillus canaveralius TaxID=1403243 RepID=UPI000F78DC36|nr:formate dehydrogenase accessory protein FdhE [Bacillus canaveralius]
MGKTNVLTADYEQLQTDIITLHEQWLERISENQLIEEPHPAKYEYPVIPGLALSINYQQYKQFIIELLDLLNSKQPQTMEAAKGLPALLTDAMAESWFHQAISMNSFYFEKFSSEYNIPQWLPFFAAEHAVRPYLQKAAAELREQLKLADHSHGCPACGEPARLAVIGKKGKKELTCPRCCYSWEEKKISCAQCGNDDHDQMLILKIEDDESMQIHVCKACNGYTKVVDTKRLLKKEHPAILDLKSIHLDYIAQERGYGVPGSIETH